MAGLLIFKQKEIKKQFILVVDQNSSHLFSATF